MGGLAGAVFRQPGRQSKLLAAEDGYPTAAAELFARLRR